MTSGTLVSLRDAYGELLPELGREEPRLVVLDADLSTSTRTGKFRQAFPERTLNVGIAEQNMVGVAAGVALAGGIPFVHTFASFLTRRAADQIAISVAYPRLNVKFFGFHAGVNLGEDGATQQAVEDVGIMQAIPGIRVYAPVDADDLVATVREVMRTAGPTYVRLSRFPSPILGQDDSTAAPAVKALRSGGQILVIVTGTLAAEVVAAADALKAQGISVRVVGVSRIKPLDPSIAALVSAWGPRPVAVAEEHNIHGGLADALSSVLDEAGVPHRLHRFGVPDRFGESGPPRELLESLGLGSRALAERIAAIVSQQPAQPDPQRWEE